MLCRIATIPLVGLVSKLCLAFSSEEWGTDNYGPGSRGPYFYDFAVYDALLDQPNATTTYQLPGPTIPKAGSSVDSLGGWSWNIEIMSDVPRPNTTTNSPDNKNVGYYTGNKITLNVPQALIDPNATWRIVSSDSSYKLCTLQWQLGPNTTDKLRQDDGSCSTVMSSQCARDIEDAAAKRFDPITGCKCPILDDISSCQDTHAWSGSCYARTFNSTVIRKWPSQHFVVSRYGGSVHEMGNTAAYNKTGSLAWPLVVVWRDFGNPEGVQGAHVANNTAKLTCIRAKDAVAGSVAPGWNVTTNSGGCKKFLGTTLLGVVSISTLLLMS